MSIEYIQNKSKSSFMLYARLLWLRSGLASDSILLALSQTIVMGSSGRLK